MVINPDAFATGFEECMNTFSQERRALRIVGWRFMCMTCAAGGVCVCKSHARAFRDVSCLKEIV